MVIAQLIKKNNRMIIVFDTGEDLKIHYDVFLMNGLRRGDDLQQKQIKYLQTQSELLYTKESALRILGRRMHSARELKQKLLQKKYHKDLVDQVITDLSGSGYVDDLAFAKQYILEKISRKDGVQKIRNELINKGISREILLQVLSEVDIGLELENAKRLAEKKALQLKTRGIDKNKLKQKIYTFLASRGYEYDLIREVVDQLN